MQYLFVFLRSGAYSMVVRNLSMSSLGLRSLTEISSGLVLLEANPNLCYLDTVPWTKIFRNSRQAILKTTNKPQNECGKSTLNKVVLFF